MICVADLYEVIDLVNVFKAKLLKDVNEDNADMVFCIASTIEFFPELKNIAFQILQSWLNKSKALLNNNLCLLKHSKIKRFSIALPDSFGDDRVRQSLRRNKVE